MAVINLRAKNEIVFTEHVYVKQTLHFFPSTSQTDKLLHLYISLPGGCFQRHFCL